MSDARDPAVPPPPASAPSVFLSYSSEDRVAARRLRDALAATGLVVWYDENELGGGDAWDQKIRREIRECDYFMPLISAATERRKEGYFRREWRLAAERTLDMADDVLFLLPIVLDETSEAGARVPDKFVTPTAWHKTLAALRVSPPTGRWKPCGPPCSRPVNNSPGGKGAAHEHHGISAVAASSIASADAAAGSCAVADRPLRPGAIRLGAGAGQCVVV